jgi:hypothetical protein
MIEAGNLGLRLTPIATGFWRDADAKLRAQKSSKAEVPVEANIRKAAMEMATFRAREQANAINLKVKIDEKSIRTANDKIRYIEHTWKQSDFKRAVRIQVYVAGATALPILSQGILSVTTAITELGKAAFALPGILAGVTAAAGTMLTGFSGVGAALKASSDGMKNSAQAARQYAQAARQLEDAQRGVVTALKNANREIEDQKDKLAQGQLSVEQARLNVERANQALRQGGFRNSLDYKEALLGVKQANLDLSLAVKQSSRDIQDYYDQAGKAATESDGYKDSLDGLADAVDRFRKAQFQAAGMSEQFISAMKNLAPAGQDFVLQILKMRGAWDGLKASIQTTLFRGLGDSITDLAQKQLPVLKTGMQQVAAGINANFKSLFTALGRTSNLSNIEKIFRNTGLALNAATPGVDSFTNGLLRLSEVGSRFLPRIALAFDKVMARFEAFVTRADNDGSLEKWINSGLKMLTSLGRSILHIGSILNGVTEAYNKATGNVGGFASTVERQLGKLAAYLSSPKGQGALISYIRQGQAFMKAVKEALPGIRDAFGVIGDAARSFAETFLPIFSGMGYLLKEHAELVALVIKTYFGFKTVLPLLSSTRKGWVSLKGSMEEYRTRQAKIIESANRAYKQHYEASGLMFAAHQRVLDNRNLINSSERIWKQAHWRLRDAQRVVDLATTARKKAEAESRKAEKATDSSLILPGGKSGDVTRAKAAERASAVVVEAKKREKEALAALERRETDYTYAMRRRSEVAALAQTEGAKAQRDLISATRTATEAQKNLNAAGERSTRANGWMGRMRMAIGSGRGGGIAGALGGLSAAFGKVTTAVGSVGATVGMIYVFDQLTAAQNRNKASADNLRESQDALAQTLSKGTGSATAATLEENSRQLRDRANPVHPDDAGQRFDAAKILQGQLSMPLSEAVTLALPTEVKNREKRLAPADDKIIAAVPGLQEWKKWGPQYRNNGVDESVYGRALNGDPESIGKVEAARKAIKDANPLGQAMNLGLATNTGYAPDDLGAAQEQLPRSGADGGLRGLSLAAGALRSVGNESLAQGRKAYEGSKVVPQGGLNSAGQRAFGPFVLGANGAVLNADGSATIEVDRYPDDVVRGWITNAAPNGISVEKRYPNGAVITIDAENGPKYFNTPPVGRAQGGPVWGAGSATSDSIPAMLSNGEFVINARSAALIGHDKLAEMNAIKRFAPGGPVKVEDSIFGPGAVGAQVYTSPTPVVNNPQTLQEAIGLPTTRQSIFGKAGEGAAGGATGRVTNPPNTLPGILGSSIFPGPRPIQQPKPVNVAPFDATITPPKATSPAPFPAAFPPPVKSPPVQSPRVDSSPVSKPLPPSFAPTVPVVAGIPSLPSPGSSVGAALTPNGNIYIPKLGGSGALGDSASSARSAAKGAPINPNANILDYLVQVGNAYGLRVGSGPPGTVEGERIAAELGIPTHGALDGGQHDFNRAIDYGNSEQANDGTLAAFVKTWMADPIKVAATRQLIYQDPKTGEAFGIINGRALAGQEAWDVFGGDFGSHQNHIHLALEGVPVNAFADGGGGAPFVAGAPGAPGAAAKPGPNPEYFTPIKPGPSSSPAVNVPAPQGPAVNVPTPVSGPAADVPFDGIDLLKKIGAALLNGIFGFFGIDGSAFVNALFGLMDPKPEEEVGGVGEYPEPDQNLLSQMESEIARQDSLGTPESKALADKLRENKDNYLKQYEDAAISRNSEELAKYYESINDPETAARIRGGIATGKPALPGDQAPAAAAGGSGFTAPPANYSGGTPETRNAVYRAFKEAGYPDSEWPALVQLLNHENDTWDPKRPTGGPNSDASGIFQFLSTTWDTVGMQYSEDPYTQGVAGMRYIKQRYGTPTGAWNFWQNPNPPGPDPNWPHWYSIGGIVQELARGGEVAGPGTGTSDSIPAMLSDGEFVMRADAVKHWGTDRLHAMNGYANGGLVRRYAPGGLVGANDSPNVPWESAFSDGGSGIMNAFADAGWIDGTRPVVPSMGMPSSAPITPSASEDSSLGLGPTPNVSNNAFLQGENQFRGGIWNALEDNVTGTIESIKDPIGTVKAMAPLVGLGGENGGIDLGLAGSTWKELGKSTLHWDEWGTDPLGALGGTVVDLGGLVTGGAAKGAQQAAKLSSIKKDLEGIDTTGLKGLDWRTRGTVRETLADLVTRFPAAKSDYLAEEILWPFLNDSGLAGIRVADALPDPSFKNAYAWADEATGFINLNPGYFQGKDARKEFRKSYLDDKRITPISRSLEDNGNGFGFHNPLPGKGNLKNAVRAVLSHEFGHFFDFKNLALAMPDSFFKALVEERFTTKYNELFPERARYSDNPAMDDPEHFSEFILSSLSGYSYEKKNWTPGTFAPHVDQKIASFGLSPGGRLPLQWWQEAMIESGATANTGYRWALNAINRTEALPEAFSDVYMRGPKASDGSIMLYEMMQDSYLAKEMNALGPFDDMTDIVEMPDAGRSLRSMYPMFPEDMSFGAMGFNDIKIDNPGGPRASRSLPSLAEPPRPAAPPRPGRGPGKTWDGFKQWANRLWEYPIELVDQKAPGNPYSVDEYDALTSYSGSSSVNKTLRGDDKLAASKNFLEQLLGVRGSMEGAGGWHPALSQVEMANRVKSLTGSQTLPSGASMRSKSNMPLVEAIRQIANESRSGLVSDVTPQQVWEATFLESIRASKRRTSSVKSNLDLIRNVDSAFKPENLLPEDVWVTRMINDFGEGPIDDPSSLLGRTITNPGYSSTAGGITYGPQLSRDWWKGVFGERSIMQQILVPQGTPGVWFGGGENELLLPRNLDFNPLGFQTFQDLLPDGDGSRYDMVSQILQSKTGVAPQSKFKVWGTMGLPDDPFASPDLGPVGFGEMDGFLRGLSSENKFGIPNWMNYMSTAAPDAEKWTPFRLPRDSNLGYAAGGHVTGPGGPKSDMIPAYLSDGEFVMNAAATKHWGPGNLAAMNKFAGGGLVGNLIPQFTPAPLAPPINPPTPKPAPPPPPSGSSDPDAFKDQPKPSAPSGSSDPDAFKDLDKMMVESLGESGAKALGGYFSPKGGGGGGSAAARAPKPKDPRAILAAAPTSDNHMNPAFASAIQGAFSTAGALANTAIQAGAAAGTFGASAAMGGAGAGQAGQLVQAGAEMAGQVAVGAANILSSLLVGTVTPSDTGQGYGAPLLPQQQMGGGGGNNFQSIHNGNVVTNNLSEYNRLKDRKDAQKAAPFFNRVNQ